MGGSGDRVQRTRAPKSESSSEIQGDGDVKRLPDSSQNPDPPSRDMRQARPRGRGARARTKRGGKKEEKERAQLEGSIRAWLVPTDQEGAPGGEGSKGIREKSHQGGSPQPRSPGTHPDRAEAALARQPGKPKEPA